MTFISSVPMKLVKDCIIQWKGFGFPITGVNVQSQWLSTCRMRLYAKDDQYTVLFTDISEDVSDKGTSITNSAENIINLVVEKYSLAGKSVKFIEEYPGSDVRFSAIERTEAGGVEWSFLGEHLVEEMLGGIPDHRGVESLHLEVLQ